MDDPARTTHTITSGRAAPEQPVLITGGAGFIGANLAQRMLQGGRDVVLLDNFSRHGVESNARWLAHAYPGRVRLVVGDTRDQGLVEQLVREASAVFHLAAQVAVTTSLVDPVHDFDVNVRGTLHVLEALRSHPTPPPLLYTSTNKVYGGLSDIALDEQALRYAPRDRVCQAGVDERRPLDFHSPYGCSKGAADQYVLDYARSFGLRATVFRMSCIYGPRQFGTEDQGWVAHFLLRAQAGAPITIFGDGKQVRDLLFVTDLVDAMVLAERHIDRLVGQAFNVGGGYDNVLSLLELLALIEEFTGERQVVNFAPPRVGDQRYYVSNIERFRHLTGWEPRVGVRLGVELLQRWLRSLAEGEDLGANGRAKAVVERAAP